MATSMFDIYCLAMAVPGSTHYGYYIISFEFVYVGNVHGKYFYIDYFQKIIIMYNFILTIINKNMLLNVLK